MQFPVRSVPETLKHAAEAAFESIRKEGGSSEMDLIKATRPLFFNSLVLMVGHVTAN